MPHFMIYLHEIPSIFQCICPRSDGRHFDVLGRFFILYWRFTENLDVYDDLENFREFRGGILKTKSFLFISHASIAFGAFPIGNHI